MAAMTSTIYANDLKLKSDHLDVCRTNCAKFHSNRSSSFVTRVVTDRQTDRHTHTHTPGSVFFPRYNHNTFSPLKKTECKKQQKRTESEWRPQKAQIIHRPNQGAQSLLVRRRQMMALRIQRLMSKITLLKKRATRKVLCILLQEDLRLASHQQNLG